MQIRRLSVVGAVAALGAATVVGVGLASPATAAPHSKPYGGSIPGVMEYMPVGGTLAEPVATGLEPASGRATATFQVTYHGFPADAKASFQRAINKWATLVTSPVPIVVDVTWEPLSPGSLGGARPDQYYYDFANAPFTNTYYASALANKLAGTDLEPTRPDIVASFNSSFADWNLSSAPAPAGKEDFQSVAMHELGHGLGFGGNGAITADNLGTITNGLNSAYDHYTAIRSGTFLTSYADPSVKLKNAITGNNLFFDSPQVRAANNGKPAKLYAPTTYEGGSSYSHLDEDTYRPGTPNSLMTPGFDFGETTRNEGPIMKAIFATIGW